MTNSVGKADIYGVFNTCQTLICIIQLFNSSFYYYLYFIRGDVEIRTIL